MSRRAELVAIGASGQPRIPVEQPLVVIDRSTGRSIDGMPVLEHAPPDVEFRAPGGLLAAAGDEVHVWSLRRQGERWIVEALHLPDRLYESAAVAFSPDGRFLAASGRPAVSWNAGGGASELGEPLVRVWSTENPVRLHDVATTEVARAVALSPAGELLAILDDEHSLGLPRCGLGTISASTTLT